MKTKILTYPSELKIVEELLSFQSLNPFLSNDSGARSYMANSHISQSLTLYDGEDRIILTGIEKQLGEATFSKKIKNTSRLVKRIPRYRGFDDINPKKIVEYLLIIEDIETNELDCISIPYYHSLHSSFGFKYNWNTNILDNIKTGDIMEKGTILADSPSKSNNAYYKFGINANVALLTVPETAKDGAIISESFAKKLNFDIFETYVIEFGENSFPLNLYGNYEVYKPFPDIGEYINDDSVLMGIRQCDDNLPASLNSVIDVMRFNPLFDKLTYARTPEFLCKDNTTKKVSQVVDIKVWQNNKKKKNTYYGIYGDIIKYYNMHLQYYNDIINVYKDKKNEHYKLTGSYDSFLISDRLHRLLVEAFSTTNINDDYISYRFRNEPTDIFRIEFTVKTHIPEVISGMKLSDSNHGSKGVIVSILPDDNMPYDPVQNIRADIIMEPSSLVNRMNPGRLYEQYICGMSRKTKKIIINKYGSDINKYTEENIIDSYNILLGLYKLIDTEQYTYYKDVEDIVIKYEIIKDVIENEAYIYYKISSDKRPHQIVKDSLGTIYQPKSDNVIFKYENKTIKLKDSLLIAPIYTILLNRISDNFLTVAGSRVNHYNLPISVGSEFKNRLPYKSNPVKILSETEVRLYTAYSSQKLVAELKDRANNINTHKHIYKSILNAEKPTNIDTLVDRNIIPYGNDSVIKLIESLFNSIGIEIAYVEDENNYYEPNE